MNYMLELERIENLIKTAVEEIGYQEKDSNTNLNDKYDNVGDGNYTKYARDIDETEDFYNGRKNGHAWCDVFVDWCFIKTFGRELAQKIIYQPNESLGAGCEYSARYYKENDAWSLMPTTGAQIFFLRDGEIGHTGIVVHAGSKYVYVVEGNARSDLSLEFKSGGNVTMKVYDVTDSTIAGYGLPNYSYEDIPLNCFVSLPILKKGDKSSTVYTLQSLLNREGYDLDEDGSFGGKTKTAVEDFQRRLGLPMTGIVRTEEWGKLII